MPYWPVDNMSVGQTMSWADVNIRQAEAPMNVWKLRRISILGLTITLVGIHPAAQGADSSIGTWVLNIPKSTFNPGPAPQSESRTYVMVHQETKLTTRGT